MRMILSSFLTSVLAVGAHAQTYPAKRIRIIVPFTPKRVAALPGVPTIAEAGFPGGEFNFWLGMLVPGKMPRETIAKVNAEIGLALKSPEVIERLAKLGAEPMSMTPAEFDGFVRKEHDELGKVRRDAGAKPQ